MTIRDPESVDYIALGDGFTSLLIADDEVWDETNRDHHFELLLAKVNYYLWYMHSGMVEKEYPEFGGNPLRIELHCAFEPGDAAQRFIEDGARVTRNQGFEFTWQVT